MRMQRIKMTKEMLVDLITRGHIIMTDLNITSEFTRDALTDSEMKLLKSLAKAPAMPKKLRCPCCLGEGKSKYFIEEARNGEWFNPCILCSGTGIVWERAE